LADQHYLVRNSLWFGAVAGGQAKACARRRFAALLAEDLDGRIAAFDGAAANAAALLAARHGRARRPVDMRDTQIAGIAIARRATLATRNVRHFEGVPSVVNPWA
jgi:toxin FitB